MPNLGISRFKLRHDDVFLEAAFDFFRIGAFEKKIDGLTEVRRGLFD